MGVESYKILEAENTQNLTEQVEKALSQGWEPIGGVCATFAKIWYGDSYGSIFLQAMIIKSS